MIRALLLAVSLLHPHHNKHQQEAQKSQQELQHQQEIAAMTRKAAGHVMVIRQVYKDIVENCPYVPQEYFDAMDRDLDKIAQYRSVEDKGFREDFDTLEADYESIIIAVDTYRNRDKV